MGKVDVHYISIPSSVSGPSAHMCAAKRSGGVVIGRGPQPGGHSWVTPVRRLLSTFLGPRAA